MKARSLLTELGILLIILLAVWISLRQLSVDPQNLIDINLHDTYFVIDYTNLIAPIFILLTTIIYFIKEGFYRYYRVVPNVILLLANFSLVIEFVFGLYAVSKFVSSLSQGWTIYPPLSELPKVAPKSNLTENTPFDEVNKALIYVISFFTITLSVAGILLGRSLRK